MFPPHSRRGTEAGVSQTAPPHHPQGTVGLPITRERGRPFTRAATTTGAGQAHFTVSIPAGKALPGSSLPRRGWWPRGSGRPGNRPFPVPDVSPLLVRLKVEPPGHQAQPQGAVKDLSALGVDACATFSAQGARGLPRE